MTLLAKKLTAHIKLEGPMLISNYMRACLLDPEFGYYTTRDPFGTQGDFITAPEISQMFGELIGLALAQAWMDQGAPSPFTLCELGPGRGTLMADILRVTKNVPGFHAAVQVWLVEASAHLRNIQKVTLPGFALNYASNVNGLPEAPTFIVANEFFDALPIRQFVRAGDGWREQMVGLAEDRLALLLSGVHEFTHLEHRLSDTRDGDIVETCAPGAAIIGTIAQRIATHGGAALLIDYGDWRSLGDTFQALEGHKPVDVLESPGRADVTAHVDFEALAEAAAPLIPARLTTQGVFLERLGITDRARMLATHLADDAVEAHIQAHRRLTHSAEMGTLFKVLGLTPKGTAPIAGTVHDT